MRKLLSVLSSAPAQNPSEVTPKRFTRFETKAAAELDSDKSFTRFPAQQSRTTPTPIRQYTQPELVPPVPRPASVVAPVQQPQVNAMDHLNSEAEIPLSIFHKALPQRFAEMQDNKVDDEYAAFFS